MEACARIMIGAHLHGTNDLHRKKSILRSNFLCQTLHLPAGYNVGEPNFIRQRSDKLIPPDGKGGRDTVLVLR